MTLAWGPDRFHWITQVAADCPGARGVRQKVADSEPSSTSALSRSSSRGEADF